MIAEGLSRAGFPAVETEGEIVFARLSASGIEFRAEPEGQGWRLMLFWPMRAPEARLAEWNAAQPEARMDIHRGETRLSMPVQPGPGLDAALTRWAALAEEGVAAMVRWRRAQRAPGEGM